MAEKKRFKFKTNIPETVEFAYSKPVTGENEHGPWFLYGVRKDGESNAFFATELLHNTLLMAGVKKGTIAVITLKERDDSQKKFWTVQIDGTEFSSDQLDGYKAPPQSTSPPGQVAVPKETPTIDDLADTIISCYNKIETLTQQRQMELGSETIEKLAISLFITVSREGLFVKHGDTRSMGDIPITQKETGEREPITDNIPPGADDDLPF